MNLAGVLGEDDWRSALCRLSLFLLALLERIFRRAFHNHQHEERKSRGTQIALGCEPLAVDVVAVDRMDRHQRPARAKTNAIAGFEFASHNKPNSSDRGAIG